VFNKKPEVSDLTSGFEFVAAVVRRRLIEQDGRVLTNAATEN
jgi:hypothetical protein